MKLANHSRRIKVATALAAAFAAGAALAGCSALGDKHASTSQSSASQDPARQSATRKPLSPQETVTNGMLQNGIKLADQGKYNDAATTFQAILAIDPNSKLALYNLGLIAQIHNQSGQAGKYYDQALKVDPKFTSALYNKAILLEPADPGQAESLYQKIVKIDPKASTSFLRLSFLYAADGHQQAADAARKSALDLDPSLATVSPARAR